MPGAFALEDCTSSSLHNMVIHAPAGTLERRYTLALALHALVPGASLTVMAAKDKGGTRLKKELESFGCLVVEDARRHFRICNCTRPKDIIGYDKAISDGTPRLIETIGLWSQPGVFSWDHLDPGSILLTNNLPQFYGSGADFGCGIGYLSQMVLKSESVKHMTLIDIDRRAVTNAKRNVTDKRAQFLWSDIDNFNASSDSLDFVVMNPPFHDTGVEDRELGEKFIMHAHRLLHTGGSCWLTANRHLPYEETLKKLYKKVTLRADAAGYKVYEAIK